MDSQGYATVKLYSVKQELESVNPKCKIAWKIR